MTPALMTMLAAGAAAMDRDQVGLIDVTDPGEALHWIAVHDSTCNGRSRGRLEVIDGRAVFSGHLGHERGGGFASVRTLPRDFGLAAATGLVLRVRGDGRTYRVHLRTDASFDGLTWQYSFPTTAAQWTTAIAPFDRCVALWRGRPVTGQGSLDPQRIQQLGFTVAGNQAGDFRLEIERVGAY